MATELSQPKHKKNANGAPREVNTMSTGFNGTLAEEDDMVTGGAGISEDPAAATDEPDLTVGIRHVGGIGDEGMMAAGAGGSSLDGEASYGSGMGCCSREGESDMTLGDICRPISPGVAASIEVLECQRGISTQGADGGVEVGLDDQCIMTDDEDDQQMVAMDSASIIPEAAMKCGILPIDSAEGNS